MKTAEEHNTAQVEDIMVVQQPTAFEDDFEQTYSSVRFEDNIHRACTMIITDFGPTFTQASAVHFQYKCLNNPID